MEIASTIVMYRYRMDSDEIMTIPTTTKYFTKYTTTHYDKYEQ